MKNIYVPFEGLEKIKFGFNRSKVRRMINLDFNEFKRNEYSNNTLDYYTNLGVFFIYTPENKLEAVEFTDDCTLIFEDENLFDLEYNELRKKYDSKSIKIEEELEIGVTYHDLGFAATKVYGLNNIESIMIFSKEYWDDFELEQ